MRRRAGSPAAAPEPGIALTSGAMMRHRDSSGLSEQSGKRVDSSPDRSRFRAVSTCRARFAGTEKPLRGGASSAYAAIERAVFLPECTRILSGNFRSGSSANRICKVGWKPASGFHTTFRDATTGCTRTAASPSSTSPPVEHLPATRIAGKRSRRLLP